MDFFECDVLIVGAGVIGLATAARLATEGRTVILLEKENLVGSMTSSRNSEVIHSGIYYKGGSLKEQLCIKGKEQLYRYLKNRSISFRKCGKVIFSSEQSETKNLEVLYQKAQQRKINVRYCDKKQLSNISEIAHARSAIQVLETGIFDSHSFLQSLVADIENNFGLVSTNTNVLSFDKVKHKMHTLCRQKHEKFIIRSHYVINTSGARALQLIKENVTQKYQEYENFFVKGHYFSYDKNNKLDKLYYPMPNALGLGVHLTTDLTGKIRFGPDTIPVSNAYDFNQAVSDESFYESVAQNFPFVKKSEITFSYAGIRPKLKINGELYDDFIFSKDYEGCVVSALGIESPGLTSSLAVAEHITAMLLF